MLKRQITLKWKLTISVVLVLIPLAIALGIMFQYLLSGTDDFLYRARQNRALANAKAVEGEITFEVAARP